MVSDWLVLCYTVVKIIYIPIVIAVNAPVLVKQPPACLPALRQPPTSPLQVLCILPG